MGVVAPNVGGRASTLTVTPLLESERSAVLAWSICRAPLLFKTKDPASGGVPPVPELLKAFKKMLLVPSKTIALSGFCGTSISVVASVALTIPPLVACSRKPSIPIVLVMEELLTVTVVC